MKDFLINGVLAIVIASAASYVAYTWGFGRWVLLVLVVWGGLALIFRARRRGRRHSQNGTSSRDHNGP
jgi:uncharacterized membrane protein